LDLVFQGVLMVVIGKTSASATAPGGFVLRSMTAAALLVAMLGLSACGTWADPTEWKDPTGLFGGGDDAKAAPVPSGNIAKDAGTNADRFPNLARVPPRPVEMSANSERRQAVDSLAADRANARYTDEELRARPADSNTPPPAPRQPVTPLPSADQAPLPRGAVEPQRRQVSQAAGQMPGQVPGQAAAGQMQQAPMQQPASQVDTYSQGLAQSAATTLPAGLTQPQGAGYSPVALPGAQQLLAIVRFGNGASGLGNDDKALIKKVAEYYKGLGAKGSLRVVAYAGPSTTGLAQRRTDNVSAELRRNGAMQLAGATTAPPAGTAGGAADDYGRRVEIYLVN
jgi:outer membrane protein OmpA-like peptidoglycan-associated protein